MEKRWIISEVSPKQAGELASALDLHPLVAKSLIQRGFCEHDKIAEFLEARLSNLPELSKFKDLEKAAAKIVDAIEKGQRICIYGDYDVDGITSTSLLVDFFRKVSYPAQHKLPSRLIEGYGFHESSVRELAKDGVNLIITVDCGISGHAACKAAKELGITVIVTDHHEIIDSLPDAYAVVNPHQEDCGFADEPLAGVGIAFFLAAAIRGELTRRGSISKNHVDMREFLDLVALGTVADVAPIVGVNRIMVNYGLALIQQGKRPGIAALKKVARLTGKTLLCGHISFQLAPRLNAAGRLGNAELGVELLTLQDESAVELIAQRLDMENTLRQKIELDILQQAREQFLNTERNRELFTIVLAGNDWHPGVIGIVASRIQEEFYRPAILITFEGGIGRGSARSIRGFNIFEAISACGEYLEGYGGHKYAAGLQVLQENLADFAVALEHEARKQLSPEDLFPTLQIDSDCDLEEVDLKLIKSLARMAPFGVGNPEPIFMIRDAEVVFKKRVGRTHLKLRLGRKKDNITAMAFGMGDLYDRIGTRVDVAFTAHLNEYQGQSDLQLTVKDLKVI